MCYKRRMNNGWGVGAICVGGRIGGGETGKREKCPLWPHPFTWLLLERRAITSNRPLMIKVLVSPTNMITPHQWGSDELFDCSSYIVNCVWVICPLLVFLQLQGLNEVIWSQSTRGMDWAHYILLPSSQLILCQNVSASLMCCSTIVSLCKGSKMTIRK